VPRHDEIPGGPGDWLARARADLALARVELPPGALYEDLCYHAEQAAEKALKAAYRQLGWGFRYVHNIEELLTGLRRQGVTVPVELDDSVLLTEYAFEARYLGLDEPVSREEYDRAVELAERVVNWAAGIVEGSAAP